MKTPSDPNVTEQPKRVARGSLRRMVQWLRQRTCSHEGYIENIYWLYVGQVACPCNKCGKVLVAEYGLSLPIKWMTKPLNAPGERPGANKNQSL